MSPLGDVDEGCLGTANPASTISQQNVEGSPAKDSVLCRAESERSHKILCDGLRDKLIEADSKRSPKQPIGVKNADGHALVQ